MFGWLHTKSAYYKLVTFAVFGAECIFGWRTGAMYQDVLSSVITNSLELYPLIVLFSVAVAVFGFALATHRQYGYEAVVKRMQRMQQTSGAPLSKGTVRAERWQIRFAVIFFISQDIAGVVYSVFGHGATPTIPLVAVTVGMCLFAIAPFFIGHMTLALAESLPQERRDQFYAHLFDLWQDTLITAASKWAKQARNADPAEILAPVMRSLLATSSGDDLHAEAVRGLFRMDGDDTLVPFRPKAAAKTSASNGATEDDEE